MSAGATASDSSRNAPNIVGTPATIVTLCSRISCDRARGVEVVEQHRREPRPAGRRRARRSTRTRGRTAAPRARRRPRAHAVPGDPGPDRCSRRGCRAMSIAARGAPAVPDVKSSTASSSSSRSTSTGHRLATVERRDGDRAGTVVQRLGARTAEHDRARLDAVELRGEHRWRRQRVQRHRHRAGPQRAEVRGDEPDVVVADDRHPVAGTDPVRGQGARAPGRSGPRARRTRPSGRPRSGPARRERSSARSEQQRDEVHGGSLADAPPAPGCIGAGERTSHVP